MQPRRAAVVDDQHAQMAAIDCRRRRLRSLGHDAQGADQLFGSKRLFDEHRVSALAERTGIGALRLARNQHKARRGSLGFLAHLLGQLHSRHVRQVQSADDRIGSRCPECVKRIRAGSGCDDLRDPLALQIFANDPGLSPRRLHQQHLDGQGPWKTGRSPRRTARRFVRGSRHQAGIQVLNPWR